MLQIQDVKDKVTRFLKQFQSEAKVLPMFGCYIQKDTLYIANPKFHENVKITAIDLQTKSVSLDKDFAVTLRRLRDQWGLTGRNGSWILDKENYQTLLIDAPEVKQSAYRAAAIWQAKELLKYPMEDCVVDVFLPSKTIETHANKLYLVAAKKTLLTQVVSGFDKAELPITSITTEEFALKNIVVELIGSDFTGILIKRSDNTYLFIVIGNKDILFTRSISGDIVSELYRSYEFYTITLKQEKIDTLYTIDLEDSVLEKISNYFLANDYNITLKTFDEIFDRYELDHQKINLPNLLALGGVFEYKYR